MPTWMGKAQILDGRSYNRYLLGQYCFKFFGYNTCRLVNNAPVIELEVYDPALTHHFTSATLKIYVRPDSHWSINGTSFPVDRYQIQLYPADNNSRLEGYIVDPMNGKGFGAMMKVSVTGLPVATGTAGALQVTIKYDDVVMLQAPISRYR